MLSGIEEVKGSRPGFSFKVPYAVTHKKERVVLRADCVTNLVWTGYKVGRGEHKLNTIKSSNIITITSLQHNIYDIAAPRVTTWQVTASSYCLSISESSFLWWSECKWQWSDVDWLKAEIWCIHTLTMSSWLWGVLFSNI